MAQQTQKRETSFTQNNDIFFHNDGRYLLSMLTMKDTHNDTQRKYTADSVMHVQAISSFFTAQLANNTAKGLFPLLLLHNTDTAPSQNRTTKYPQRVNVTAKKLRKVDSAIFIAAKNNLVSIAELIMDICLTNFEPTVHGNGAQTGQHNVKRGNKALDGTIGGTLSNDLADNLANRQKEAAVFVASADGSLVKKLLKSRNLTGATPLRVACWNGHSEVVELFLKYASYASHTADIVSIQATAKQRTLEPKTRLNEDDVGLVGELLLDKFFVSDEYILHNAVRQGYLAVAEVLLKYASNLQTPLCTVVEEKALPEVSHSSKQQKAHETREKGAGADASEASSLPSYPADAKFVLKELLTSHSKAPKFASLLSTSVENNDIQATELIINYALVYDRHASEKVLTDYLKGKEDRKKAREEERAKNRKKQNLDLSRIKVDYSHYLPKSLLGNLLLDRSLFRLNVLKLCFEFNRFDIFELIMNKTLELIEIFNTENVVVWLFQQLFIVSPSISQGDAQTKSQGLSSERTDVRVSAEEDSFIKAVMNEKNLFISEYEDDMALNFPKKPSAQPEKKLLKVERSSWRVPPPIGVPQPAGSPNKSSTSLGEDRQSSSTATTNAPSKLGDKRDDFQFLFCILETIKSFSAVFLLECLATQIEGEDVTVLGLGLRIWRRRLRQLRKQSLASTSKEAGLSALLARLSVIPLPLQKLFTYYEEMGRLKDSSQLVKQGNTFLTIKKKGKIQPQPYTKPVDKLNKLMNTIERDVELYKRYEKQSQ